MDEIARSNNPFVFWFALLIFGGTAIGMLTFAGYSMLKLIQRNSRSIVTVGTIMDFTEGNEAMVFPMVRFITQDGREVEFKSNNGRRAGVLQAGQTVSVRYEPDKPDEADLAGFVNEWLPVIGSGVIGAASVLVVLLLLPSIATASLSELPPLQLNSGSACFGVGSIVLVLLLVTTIFSTIRFLLVSVQTSGTITAIPTMPKGRDFVRATIQFTTHEGQLITFQEDVSTSSRLHPGSTVAVRYDRYKPQTARINSWFAFIFPLIWLLVAIMFALVFAVASASR